MIVTFINYKIAKHILITFYYLYFEKYKYC